VALNMVLAQDGKTSQFPDHKVYPHAQRPIQCWRIQTASGEHCTGSKCDDLIERKGLLYAIDVEKAFGVFGEPAGDLVNGHKLLHPLVVFVISGWTVQILLKNPHPPLGIALLISKDIQPVLFVTRVQKVPMLSEVGSSDTDSAEKPPATFEDVFWRRAGPGGLGAGLNESAVAIAPVPPPADPRLRPVVGGY
jgi:hypothetical protein